MITGIWELRQTEAVTTPGDQYIYNSIEMMPITNAFVCKILN